MYSTVTKVLLNADIKGTELPDRLGFCWHVWIWSRPYNTPLLNYATLLHSYERPPLSYVTPLLTYARPYLLATPHFYTAILSYTTLLTYTSPLHCTYIHHTPTNLRHTPAPAFAISLLSYTAKKQYRKFETIIPRKETARLQFLPTFMFLWAIFIFPWSICLFSCRKIGGPAVGIYISLTDTECGNWDWGRALPFLGIYKSKFLCSAGHTLQNVCWFAGTRVRGWCCWAGRGWASPASPMCS
jgi:hypothetical protein